MKNIAIITARGGSKRIPKKNIKDFMGKPMLAYAIEAAINSEIFDEVMVSTDSEEIAQVAIKYGAKVPFTRSEKTANDFATTTDVLNEVIEEYKKLGIVFDEFCCIYPCVPFLTGDILKNAHEKFVKENAEALMPAVKFSFPIQRALYVNQDGFLAFREPENALVRTQDLKTMYHDVGMFYFLRTNSFLEQQKIICNKTTLFELSEKMVQDIDTIDDWKIAEMKYKLIKEGF